jgi:sulfide dehydrogenase [flavocytochrome c] flavoprotein subunit
MTVNRRDFIRILGAGAALGLAGAPMIGHAAELMPKGGRRIVVVGGGFGGTIAAKYARMADPSIEVVLIDRDRSHFACPFSNLHFLGTRDIGENEFGYSKMASTWGVRTVFGEVTAIDGAAKRVVLEDGFIRYDRLILSPGIDFRFDEIEGYDAKATPLAMPHAWKAGEQTRLLKRQLDAMANGDTAVIAIPLAPYRCPPGPYERACMVAAYLKQHKPRSKLLVIDGNEQIASKGKLFAAAWEQHYKNIIEYRPSSKVVKVDTKAMSIDTGIEEIKGAVINVIPPQKAGLIAAGAGVLGEDKKWCPVNPITYESTKVPGIHVIGDAASVAPMPKSGNAANSQGKVCAYNVVQLMNGKQPMDPTTVNVCYSYITADQAISISAVYKVGADGKITDNKTTKTTASLDSYLCTLEAKYGVGWITAILDEMTS